VDPFFVHEITSLLYEPSIALLIMEGLIQFRQKFCQTSRDHNHSFLLQYVSMIKLRQKEINKFQEKILTWYGLHQRDLPWREVPFDTSLQRRDPYKILVSEIMLQQTQVNRVIPKFDAWLKTFPTVFVLAKAPTSEVLALWSGLGYNRRALNLKKTAVIVSVKYGGVFPQTEKELMSLPGIGQYTARAVLCFAFDQQVAVVDTNVRKVILTEVLKETDETNETKGPKEIAELAERLLPKGKAYEWNQALMDYASAVLKKEKIPVTKQSKFHGSRRYYRGQILKVLLEKKIVAIKDLGILIKNDYASADKQWLEVLLREMTQEGFIVIKNKTVQLTA
jgi:A/G-specific adenine glycosylase